VIPVDTELQLGMCKKVKSKRYPNFTMETMYDIKGRISRIEGPWLVDFVAIRLQLLQLRLASSADSASFCILRIYHGDRRWPE
jgi:hypothetical protein